MSNQAWINLAYLTASMLFIMAFKLMTGPRTAVRGNYLGAPVWRSPFWRPALRSRWF